MPRFNRKTIGYSFLVMRFSSSRVVAPSRTLRTPSCFKVTIPFAIASFLISPIVVPAKTALTISSLGCNISKIPIRPLYPVPLQKVHLREFSELIRFRVLGITGFLIFFGRLSSSLLIKDNVFSSGVYSSAHFGQTFLSRR